RRWCCRPRCWHARCRPMVGACTAWPPMRRPATGCSRRDPRRARHDRHGSCTAAPARRPPAARSWLVAAGPGLVVAGRGPAGAAAGAGRVPGVALAAPPALVTLVPARNRRGRAAAAAGAAVGAAAPRRAPGAAGRGTAAGRGLAALPRWRPRPGIQRRSRAAAARRRLPPAGGCRRGGTGRRAGARALPGTDGRAPGADMSAWLAQAWDGFAGFAWPWAWAALPLPLLVRLLLPPRRDAGAALRVPWSAQLQDVAPGGGATGVRGGLALLAWLLLCVAAARPQQLGEAVAPQQQARQMLLAVDLSGSMSEVDMMLGMQPVDRLTAAKAVIADFLQRRSGDRVGLLVFGQRAYMLTPLTLDLAAVREQLRDTAAGMAGRETALGDAIGLAVKRLREQPEGQRVLVLLTDGVNTAGVLPPLKAAELAATERVRVHTIAFGGSGGGF